MDTSGAAAGERLPQAPAGGGPRRQPVIEVQHRRADAARNHQRLIDAAAEVFAARGLDATLDDIARHAGVNVATAYRHFANKHELAQEFLQQCVDRAVAIAEEAAAEPDPWLGLTHFLERSLDMIASNRALVDVLKRTYGSEHFGQLLQRMIVALDQLLVRGRAAGVVRADVTSTDLAAILEMLSAVTGRGVPGLPHRYIGLVLAGLRPSSEPLPGEAPTQERLLEAAAAKPARA